ncbi:MAG: AAA family ATPase [Planctomycetia bacterium]|nr:AAA family ATPase [Planctomycetia bacterium]
MILKELNIDHFGRWNNLRLKNLSEGVNLFYGPNETGKTTLMQFVRSVFYGFNPARLAYVSPTEPARTGGQLVVSTPQGDFTLERFLFPYEDSSNESLPSEDGVANPFSLDSATLPRTNSPSTTDFELPFYTRAAFQNRFVTRRREDGLKIFDENQNQKDPFFLQQLMGIRSDEKLGADETIFTTIFSLGLRELQQISALEATDAAKRLYELSTGLERYSNARFLAQLETEMMELLHPQDSEERIFSNETEWILCPKNHSMLVQQWRGNKKQMGWILQQLQYRHDILLKLDSAQSQSRQYSKIYLEKEKVAAEIKNLEREIEAESRRLHALNVARKLASIWREREKVDDEIVSFSSAYQKIAAIPEEEAASYPEKLASIREISQSISSKEEERVSLDRQLKERRDALSKLPPPQKNMRRRLQTEAILQQQEWIETLCQRLENLRRARLDSEAQISIDYRRVGLEPPNFAPDSDSNPRENEAFPYDSKVLRSLRTPLRELKHLQVLYQRKHAERQELLNQANEIDAKIQAYSEASEARISKDPIREKLPLLADFPHVFYDKKTTEDSAKSNESPESISPTEGEKRSSSSSSRLDPLAIARAFGEIASQLRREELNIQQFIQMIRSGDELDAQRSAALARCTLGSNALLTLGGLFVLGLSFSLYESIFLFGFLKPGSYALALLIFIASTLLWLGCILWKFYREKSAQLELQRISEENRTHRAQMARQFVACFGSDSSELSPSEDPSKKLDVRALSDLCATRTEISKKKLDFLQRELEAAESATVLISQRDANLLEAGFKSRRLKKLFSEIQSAKSRLKEALRSVGLPEDWGAANVRELADSSDRLYELWRRRGRDMEDFALYRRELTLLADRVAKLANEYDDVDFEAIRDDSQIFPFKSTIFQKLRDLLDEEDAVETQRSTLLAECEHLAAQVDALEAEVRRAEEKRAELLRRANVESEEELLSRLERVEEIKRLRDRRRDAQREIDAQTDPSCSENILWDIFHQHSDKEIEEKVVLQENLLSERRFQLETAQKRLAECETQMSSIVNDALPSRLAYELALCNGRIQHALLSWKSNAMARRLAETIQKTYLQKRQPQTLERTSFYLEKMTNGKYPRVWTPVDEDVLFVSRRDGASFSSEQLSSGTRELLFLAIRLALMEEYQSKGIRLPILLDDVLVNFDKERATLAAQTLSDFAGDSRQILFFTSHEHIRDIFEENDAVVCDMSQSAGGGKSREKNDDNDNENEVLVE